MIDLRIDLNEIGWSEFKAYAIVREFIRELCVGIPRWEMTGYGFLPPTLPIYPYVIGI